MGKGGEGGGGGGGRGEDGVMKRHGYNSSMCAINMWPIISFCCWFSLFVFCLTVDAPMFYIL